MSELHGVETIELTAGTMAVTTIKTAVIGLVGTAPDASFGTCARITAGTELLDNLLSLEADQPGRIGNQYKVIAVAAVPDNNMSEPIESSADYHSGILTLTLGCDAEGVVTAKAYEVVALVAQLAHSKIRLLPTNGQGVVIPFSVELSGGEDEPYPLNTAVVMVGTNQLHRLGESGTLKQALMDINDQRAALTIVVRVEQDNDKSRQRAAILNGMRVWSQSASVTDLTPRVLIATGFSEDDAVGKGLEAQANKLRAVAYVDCASMVSAQEVVQRRQLYGARVELLRPRVLVTDKNGENRYMPYSARAAGLRARIDVEKGWWWSKSNQDIYNIIGVEQADEFILGEPNCQANLLNMENISTIIRRNGFKHWGNRLCTVDPQWRFESVRRSADVIEDSIQETVLLYSDRPLDRDIAEDIIGTINAYMRQLIGLKAIFGGEAWLDEELNTRESLAAGQLYINYDFGPKSPTERITLRVRVNKDYAIEEMTS